MKPAVFATAIVALATAVPAHALFTLQNTNGADGFVQTVGPQSFVLFGGNNGAPGGPDGSSLTTYFAISAANQSLSFTWNYLTEDVDGSDLDPAGYFINSVFFQLSPLGLPQGGTANGTQAITLLAGDVLGFYVAPVDTVLGRGSLGIAFDTPLIAAVPEPGTWAMMIIGFGMAGGALRYRRRSTKVSFATA